MKNGNNATNVTAGKPKVGGAVAYAPLGTTLPISASEALSDDWTCLGYVSEDGVTNTNTPDGTDIKAWGGDTVLHIQSSKDDLWKFKLIEAMNEDVLKAVYGSANVTVANGVTTIKANSDQPDDFSWVIDMVLKGNAVKRIVIPDASLSDLADIVYSDSDAAGYDITLTAVPDTAGNTHYEYIEGGRLDVSYTVTVQAGEGGTAFANVSAAKAGDTVTIAAVASDGYTFDEWTSEDVIISASASATTTFTMPDKPVTIEASFTES